MIPTVHHQTLAVSRAAQRTWRELTGDAIPIVPTLPPADGITGAVDLVCSSEPDRDWGACLLVMRALGDAVRLVFPVQPSPALELKLDAVGYTIHAESPLRYGVRRRRPATPPDTELGLVGPLACRLLGGRRGAVEVDGPVRLATLGSAAIVHDGTAWGAWLDDLAGAEAGASQRPRFPPPASTPLIEVDIGGLPRPVDTSPLRPVVALAHPFVRRSEVAAAASRLGATAERIDELRIGRPPMDRVAETRALHAAVRRAAEDASLLVLPATAFRNDLDRALAAVVAGSIGVPVIADRTVAMARYLGPQTLAAIREAPARQLAADALARDRHGVRLLRAVEIEHGKTMLAFAGSTSAGLVPALSISVIVWTSTGSAAERAVVSIRSQNELPVAEILVAGPAPAEALGSAPDGVAGGVAVSLVPGDRSTHPAERLNRALSIASGDLIALWSDTDYYGPDHLRDVIAGLFRARADVAGKAPEFDYLEALDVTIQRSPDDRYRYTTEVSPRSVALRRVTALELGGFPRTLGDPRAALLTRIAESGGRVYRTHGLGHLVYSPRTAPSSGAHCDAVLSRGVRQWRGLALAEAGVSAGPIRRTRRYR